MDQKTYRTYPQDKYIIALTGGIATGKSYVSKILQTLGAGIVDTDRIARKVVEPGTPLLYEIREIWGDDLIKKDGTLDRSKLASIIFSSDKDREKLNNLMHPAIRKVMYADVKKLKQNLVFIIIPLLYEAKIPIKYDESWIVSCTPDQQMKRLMGRDKITRQQAQKRIDSQIPIDEKRNLCDIVIDNTGTPEMTFAHVFHQWQELLKRASF
ncbi:MAG: dephospho-CoA kinase [Candidatus Eremiobacteraeota bacterium]|nr:dephospho-CoA kinase [Candidatus Eremiobacteraeota bacterium]